jgi:ligand-binding sensor domain-containing protein
MRKSCLRKQIYFFVLSIISIACYGQTDGYMFRSGILDKNGNLWFSNFGKGVYRYEVATDKFINFTVEDGLNDNNVESIYEDKAGNLWFSTEHGVCVYNGTSFTDVSAKAGLCKFDINNIIQDRHGEFWICTNSWGVSRYNPITGAVANYTKEQGLGSNAVQCILEDKEGNIWVGERAGGVSRFDSSFDRFYIVSKSCFSSQIMGIIEDHTGKIWFANLYKGVCRYDPATGVYTHFTETDGFCNDTVTCIYQDKKGNIWFGCGSSKLIPGVGGLCRYDGKSFNDFGEIAGLASTDVWFIVEDNEGNLWVGTRGGLFRYHSPSGKFLNYTHKLNRSN